MLDPLRFAELRANSRLPSPSHAALELIDLLRRDDVSLGEICRTLQMDPAMVGRVLKFANSAVFARPRPAMALTPDVLMTLGLPIVRQLALVFSLIDNQRGGSCKVFDYGGFWSRSLAMAAAAQLVGSASRVAPAAEMFTLGLTCDIGRLALAAIEPERYAGVLQKVGAGETAALAAAECAAFGFDHAELSVALLADWGFPRMFQEAVRYSEQPEAQEALPDSRPARLTLVLRLARLLSGSYFLPDENRAQDLHRFVAQAGALGIEAQTSITIADESLRAWREWGELLSVRTFPLVPFSVLEIARDTGATSGTASDASGDAARPRILVVDDDATLRRLLERLLTATGYEVRTAGDGTHAVEAALAWHPEIVITDLMMPRRDGYALLRDLRASEAGRQLYLVVLTSIVDDARLAEAFALGADDYLTKPLQPKVLLARLSAGVRVVRLQQGLARRNLELAAALRRAEEAALTDTLTGLPNRRYAVEQLSRECAAAERGDRPLSVLMLDIDHFKRINDAHGHAVGDAVLVEIARRLNKTSRTSDVACRFGGEEFLIIAVDTPLADTTRLAERIRVAIAAHPVSAGNLSIPVTASIGVAEKNMTCTDLDVLLKAADDALYRAKAEGRDRVWS